MGVLSSIELPHWLMIGGAILTTMGFLGLAFTRNKEVATNPDPEPPAPRSKMPPRCLKLEIPSAAPGAVISDSARLALSSCHCGDSLAGVRAGAEVRASPRLASSG